MVSGESVWHAEGKEKKNKKPWQVLHTEAPNLFSVTLSGPFHVSKDTQKVLEKWAKARATRINSLTLTARAFLIGGRRGRIALSSLTFPKWQLCFSAAATSVNFISKWDLEGLGLKSAPSFWFPLHNDFHRVQDLKGGEIMSTSHYCKLYPRLQPSLNS